MILKRHKTVTAQVIDIIDGDTIVVTLAGQHEKAAEEKVRDIGVATPEVHHPTKDVETGGPEATAANRRLVAGKTVRLEFDVQERDRYKWLLAYVYVGTTMINAELVRQGYAQVMDLERAPDSIVRDNIASFNQQNGMHAGPGTLVSGNVVASNQVGIGARPGCTVLGNTMRLNGTGLILTQHGGYANNVLAGNGMDVSSSGTNLGHNRCSGAPCP